MDQSNYAVVIFPGLLHAWVCNIRISSAISLYCSFSVYVNPYIIVNVFSIINFICCITEIILFLIYAPMALSQLAYQIMTE